MLNFLLLVVHQYIIIICSHPRPLQHTSPQYVGLDVHLTNMSQLQTRSSTMKKLHNCAVPFVFSCQALCQASFRPFPFGLKSTRTNVSFWNPWDRWRGPGWPVQLSEVLPQHLLEGKACIARGRSDVRCWHLHPSVDSQWLVNPRNGVTYSSTQLTNLQVQAV